MGVEHNIMEEVLATTEAEEYNVYVCAFSYFVSDCAQTTDPMKNFQTNLQINYSGFRRRRSHVGGWARAFQCGLRGKTM